MKCFWLGTWGAGGGATPGALEVLQDGDRYVVLISAADDPATPVDLECKIGFCNDAKACNAWRSRGFPVVDAAIRLQGASTIEVFSSYFAENENGMRYGDLLLTIDGVHFEQAADSAQQVSEIYRQYKEAPSTAKSATELQRKSVQWQVARSLVKKAGAGASIAAAAAREPSLSPLGKGKTVVTRAWTGVYEGPVERGLAKSTQSEIVDRGAKYRDAAFQFKDIEVLSMRIDLGESDAVQTGCKEWVNPLNFRTPPDFDPGFSFEVATPVIQVILLRYGRMQAADDGAAADYQSQHELVVRLLVGKVDSGGSTHDDLAIHTPAIFVDNPWSKVIGRELQGFEKCLAAFCVGEGAARSRLNPDGSLADGSGSRALSDITRIELVDLVSTDPTSNGPQPLLEIRCPPDEGDWNLLQKPGGLVLMTSDKRDPAWPGWRVEDFGTQVQFDGFLRNRLWYNMTLFHSIQATPVDGRGLPPAWISAVCEVDGLTWQLPSGGDASLVDVTFHAPESAPQGWKKLYELLGPNKRKFKVADWYRSKFSMKLTAQDKLYGGHSDN